MSPIIIRLLMQGQQQVAAAFGSLNTSLASTASLLGRVGSAAGAFAIARQMYIAATESDVALAQLRQTLQSTGNASRDFESALLSQADALERLTGNSDEAVIGVQRILLSLGATESGVKSLTPLVLDLAANMGTDLNSAAKLVGSAMDGQSVSLGRLNIRAKDAEDLAHQLERAVGGQARAFHAARGPLGDVQALLGQIAENAGALIKVPVDFLFGKLSGVLGLVNAHLKETIEMARFLGLMGAGGGLPATSGGGTSNAETRRDLDIRKRRHELALEENRAYQAQAMATTRGVTQQEEMRNLLAEELRIMERIGAIETSLFEMGAVSMDEMTAFRTKAILDRAQNFEDQRNIQFQPDDNDVSDQIYARMDDLVRRIGTAAQQIGHAFDSIATSSIDSISDGLTGLLEGTTRWGEALDRIRTGIMHGIISAITRMFTEWVVGRTMAFVKEVAFSTAEAAAKAPGALLTSITSYGAAAIIGVGAFLAAMAATGSFATGGYTGDGPRNQPAGVVHRGEVVWSQSDVAAHGGASRVNAMRVSRRMPGYASGGIVGAESGMAPQIDVVGPTVVFFDDRQKMQDFFDSNPGKKTVVSLSASQRMAMGIGT